MTGTPRAIPEANSYTDTQPFWDGVKEGRLMVQRCNQTRKLQWPPRPVSIHTGRRDLSWAQVCGAATLYSWTVTRSAWSGHEGRVPYICAYVRLSEGVRMLCNLIDCDPEQLTIGMSLRLVWDELQDGARYPAFTPATPAASKP
jgi:uncharacterized protein